MNNNLEKRNQSAVIVTDNELRELCRHGPEEFPVECRLHDPLNFDVLPHWHDDLELTYVCSGRVNVIAGRFEGTLEKGDFLLINSGVLHSLYGDKCEPCVMKTAIFDPHIVGDMESSIFWKKYMRPFINSPAHQVIKISEESEITELFLMVWDAFAEKKDGYEFNIRAWLSQMVWKLSRLIRLEQNESRNDRDRERIKQMIMFIENHYSEKIAIADIAHSANVSESECIRCFKRITKDTPMHYLTELRLQKAAQQLTDTLDDIGNIGYNCGFTEPSYFIRLFKKAYKTTPGKFRTGYMQRSQSV